MVMFRRDVESLINDVIEVHNNYGRYYLFTLDDAAHVIHTLNNVFPWSRRYVEVSFYNNPEKDQTVALKLIRDDWATRGSVRYLDQRVEEAIQSVALNSELCRTLYSMALEIFNR